MRYCRLRIAFVVNTFPAVSETFILRQITGLMDRGHEVDIYAEKKGSEGVVHRDVERYGLNKYTYYMPEIPREILPKIVKTGITFVRGLSNDLYRTASSVNVIRDGWRKMPSRIYWTKYFNKCRQYDVIHCHFAPNGIMALWWRKIGCVAGKILTSFHGYDINREPKCYDIDDYKMLFTEGDAFTVNSDFTRRNAESLGCPRYKIVNIPVGLDIRQYKYTERYIHIGNVINLLTVGRLVEKKGIEYAIKAFAKLARHYESLRYIIVGDGKLRPYLEELICSYGLNGQVKLQGWKTQEELCRLFNEAHIFVCPSVICSNGDQEAQGLVLQEAQACGLPVVATNIGGIPESVVPGKSALLVPEKDPDALAERIEYLLDHPETWPTMSRIGRAYVEANYDIDKLNDRLIELYKRMLEAS